MSATTNLTDILSDTQYNRYRWRPMPGDAGLYLHLSDLRIALEAFATDAPLIVLDYGCGGSPYRPLFPNADYRRADIGPAGDLDYELDATGIVPEESEVFDLILSTQVVEHLQSPATYFAECHRLLRAGGRLICTTHGTFEDHGCPYDYQRWTAYGLQRDIEAAGFGVTDIYKLTTGPRALLYLIDRGWLCAPPKGVLGVLLLLMRGLIKLFRRQLHRMCDVTMADYRVVSDHLDDHPLYIVLLMVGQKK